MECMFDIFCALIIYNFPQNVKTNILHFRYKVFLVNNNTVQSLILSRIKIYTKFKRIAYLCDFRRINIYMEENLLFDNDIVVDAQIVAAFITKLKIKTGLSYEAIAEKCKVSVSTIKNLCLAKCDNPGIGTVARIIYTLGGSMDEMLNPGKSKDNLKEISVASLKEMYEFQVAERNKANEEHIANIRSHYEQHHSDLKENYEKRLSDKREIIEAYKEHLETKEKETKWLKRVCLLLFLVFAALCIVELANPTLGWIRF